MGDIRAKQRGGPEVVWGPRKSFSRDKVCRLRAKGKRWRNQVSSGGKASEGQEGGSRAHSWRLENKGRGFGEEAWAADDTGQTSQRTSKFILKAMEVTINRKQSGVGVLKINLQNREQTGGEADRGRCKGTH